MRLTLTRIVTRRRASSRARRMVEHERSASRIRTFLRLRPSARPAIGSSIRAVQDEGLDAVEDETARPRVVECVERASSSSHASSRTADSLHKFAFDGVFDESCDQSAVFDAVGRDVVDAATRGYNATLFAYGQTGSGKTYTLTGGPKSYEDRGIIPRALTMIFARIAEIAAEEDAKFTVEVNYVEIYMEQGYDLLATTLDERQSSARGFTRASEIPLPKIRLMEDELGCMHTMDLTTHVVTSEAAALDLLFIGDTNRAVAETPLNMASSRSHCIFTVIITRRSRGADTLRRAKLNLVDLAGSERVHKSLVDGTTLQEAKYINVSLHFLEQVIVALQERADGNESVHIPYRNSLMTMLLRDSLGGNCQTVMIATASADSGAFDESVSTCRFAQRVRKISNEVFINEELDVETLIARLKEENKRLRVELALLRRVESSEDAALQLELSADALEILRAQVRRYVEEDDFILDCGSSVTKIRIVQETLRDMCRSAKRTGQNDKGNETLDAKRDVASSHRRVHREQSSENIDQKTEHSSSEEEFMIFCRDVSRTAPALRSRSDELRKLTTDARSTAREMNELKAKINVDLGVLDALRIARVVDASVEPSDRERELERATSDRRERHARLRDSLDALRAPIERCKRDIASLKDSLRIEYDEYRDQLFKNA